MTKVRANTVYRFIPNTLDRLMPEHYSATSGQLVRVINLPGAPKANTMGQAHIEDASTREFLGMVSVHSLQPLPRPAHQVLLKGASK